MAEAPPFNRLYIWFMYYQTSNPKNNDNQLYYAL